MPGKHALKVFSHHPGASATIPGSAEVSRWKKISERLTNLCPAASKASSNSSASKKSSHDVNLKIYPMLKGRFIISKTVSSQDFLASPKKRVWKHARDLQKKILPGKLRSTFMEAFYKSFTSPRLACDLELRRLWALLALRRLRLPGDIGARGWLPQKLKKKIQKNVLESWTIFQYIKRGDLLNGKFLVLEQRHALTSYETHQIMVAMQSAEFSILQSLLYTSRLSRHVKLKMCSEHLVGGWDRHGKKATQNGTKFPSKWKKGWHQIVSTIFVNRNQLVSPRHLVEAMLMWHGLSTVNVGAERLAAEDFARCKCFLSRSSLLWGRIRLAKVILITQIEQKTVRSKRSKAMKSPCQWNSSNESWGYPTNMSIWKLIVHATQSWTVPSNGQSVVKWRLPCDVSKRFKKVWIRHEQIEIGWNRQKQHPMFWCMIWSSTHRPSLRWSEPASSTPLDEDPSGIQIIKGESTWKFEGDIHDIKQW